MPGGRCRPGREGGVWVEKGGFLLEMMNMLAVEADLHTCTGDKCHMHTATLQDSEGGWGGGSTPISWGCKGPTLTKCYHWGKWSEWCRGFSL